MEGKKERYQIYNLNNDLLVDDLILSHKYRLLMNTLNGEGKLISFDNKHFLNLKSKNFMYKKMDINDDFKPIKFDLKNFKNYKIDSWHKICFDKELIDDTVDIYRENDINELDPEVKDLVNTINKLPFAKTIASCSGHGTEILLVGIHAQHIMVLEILSKIISDNFNRMFVITNECGYIQQGVNCGFSFNIESTYKGEKAYDLAKKLRDKIEEYISNNLAQDYEKKLLNDDYINEDRYKNVDGIDEEISILKNTLNKINSVCVNELTVDENINYINLIFYDKNILDDILEILWENFKKDFVLKTNRDVRYVDVHTKSRGTCLTLFFIAKENEIIDKIRALNEILQKETKLKNIDELNKEVQILKNTFDGIRSVYCDGHSIDEKIGKGNIYLMFYDKNILDDILKILWDNFNNDFVLKTNSFHKYVNEDTDNRGTCLTLEFMIKGIETINKIRALNEILKNQITDKK